MRVHVYSTIIDVNYCLSHFFSGDTSKKRFLRPNLTPLINAIKKVDREVFASLHQDVLTDVIQNLKKCKYLCLQLQGGHF